MAKTVTIQFLSNYFSFELLPVNDSEINSFYNAINFYLNHIPGTAFVFTPKLAGEICRGTAYSHLLDKAMPKFPKNSDGNPMYFDTAPSVEMAKKIKQAIEQTFQTKYSIANDDHVLQNAIFQTTVQSSSLPSSYLNMGATETITPFFLNHFNSNPSIAAPDYNIHRDSQTCSIIHHPKQNITIIQFKTPILKFKKMNGSSPEYSSKLDGTPYGTLNFEYQFKKQPDQTYKICITDYSITTDCKEIQAAFTLLSHKHTTRETKKGRTIYLKPELKSVPSNGVIEAAINSAAPKNPIITAYDSEFAEIMDGFRLAKKQTNYFRHLVFDHKIRLFLTLSSTNKNRLFINLSLKDKKLLFPYLSTENQLLFLRNLNFIKRRRLPNTLPHDKLNILIEYIKQEIKRLPFLSYTHSFMKNPFHYIKTLISNQILIIKKSNLNRILVKLEKLNSQEESPVESSTANILTQTPPSSPQKPAIAQTPLRNHRAFPNLEQQITPEKRENLAEMMPAPLTVDLSLIT